MFCEILLKGYRDIERDLLFDHEDMREENVTSAGASASASSGTSNPINDVNAANSTADTFTNFEIYIPGYASSTYKNFSIDSAQETNATTAYTELWAMLWSNSAAITSITLNSDANWVSGSSFYLYGIKNS